MLLSRLFGRTETRSIRRPLAHRRPVLEALEGRQLLTTFISPDLGIVGNHIGTNVSGFIVRHPDTSISAGVGNHIGVSINEVMIKH